MRLAIASRDALPVAIDTWHPSAVVTAFSPSRPVDPPWDGPWLPMAFHDTEGAVPLQARIGPLPTLPTPAHVTALVALIEAHGAGMALLVTCQAGLGRAPAIAIVAAIATGMRPDEAVAAVHQAVPEASPNRLFLHHAERVLGCRIVRHVDRAWASRRGRHGALGVAVGLRPVPTPPPLAGPPQEMQDPQAALGAALHLGQPKNGVPTPLAGSPPGGPQGLRHPDALACARVPAASPGPRGREGGDPGTDDDGDRS